METKNYKYCVDCGTELLCTDAVCHVCPTFPNIEQSQIPTVELHWQEPLNIQQVEIPPVELYWEEPVRKIQINIRKVAERIGIKNAYQFGKFSGFSPSTASALFKGNWRNISIKSLAVICNTLNCTPNDIFTFIPDISED